MLQSYLTQIKTRACEKFMRNIICIAKVSYIPCWINLNFVYNVISFLCIFRKARNVHIPIITVTSYEHHGVSNNRYLPGLFKSLFRLKSQKHQNSVQYVLCDGNSLVMLTKGQLRIYGAYAGLCRKSVKENQQLYIRGIILNRIFLRFFKKLHHIYC